MKLDIEKREVIYYEGETEKRISFDMIEKAYDLCNKEIYYKEDVKNGINDRIESGELPSSSSENIEYINALTEEYFQNRKEAEGDSEGGSWLDCLNAAFNDIDYNNF